MRRLHLIFGILLFVVFLVTGQYMRADFPDKEAISPELRLLMRSRHIYILFSSLIHLALGAYLNVHAIFSVRAVQCLGSILLLISSGLLVWAFVSETYSFQHYSDLSRYGIYISLAGIALHLPGGLGQKHDR